ncbi:MAG: hypothetical protein IPL88_09850 [Rhizobiales bacterium]|nr:hypothetical protein [Hyphomicrobiales bacterium]
MTPARTPPPRCDSDAPSTWDRLTRIPNWFAVIVALAFATAAAFMGLSLSDIGWRLATAAGVFVGGVALYMLLGGALGAGAVKLAAALSLWIGPGTPLAIFLVGALVGGLALAVGAEMWRRAAGREPLGVPMLPPTLAAFAVALPMTETWRALAPMLG